MNPLEGIDENSEHWSEMEEKPKKVRKPNNMIGKLEFKRDKLIKELDEVNAALDALGDHPEILKHLN